jgi:hypothetical protein
MLLDIGPDESEPMVLPFVIKTSESPVRETRSAIYDEQPATRFENQTLAQTRFDCPGALEILCRERLKWQVVHFACFLVNYNEGRARRPASPLDEAVVSGEVGRKSCSFTYPSAEHSVRLTPQLRSSCPPYRALGHGKIFEFRLQFRRLTEYGRQQDEE